LGTIGIIDGTVLENYLGFPQNNFFKNKLEHIIQMIKIVWRIKVCLDLGANKT